MRIGILGGTFDPPHLGHLRLAEAAREALNLDEILFIPANRNPLKSRKTSHPKDRLEMTRLAALDHPWIAVSDIEIARGGPSYTIDTLSELQAVRPGDYWVILGSDAVLEFSSWKSPERVLQKARLAVAVRPPRRREELAERLSDLVRDAIDWIELSMPDISSTEIRMRIEEGRPFAHWVPAAVAEYIERKALYR